MKILHFTQTDYTVGQWSGGTTTELFIWPAGSDYSKRQFRLRVSSARVDLEESDFTPLEGVVRYITPLSGGFTLTHPGAAPVVMAPLDQPYGFSGETPTHCVGKATDFNLMLKSLEGAMAVCGGTAQIRPGFQCFYPLTDSVFAVGGHVYQMKAQELLVVFSEETGTIDLGHGKTIACWANI